MTNVNANKAQELVIEVLNNKLATRSELAEQLGIHPDTLSGIKTGKKPASEKTANNIIAVIENLYPETVKEIETEEIEPEEAVDEPGLFEGKETTIIEFIANDTGASPRKIRRILRKLFGKLPTGTKTWNPTPEQHKQLLQYLYKKSK